jgi:ribosomal protein S27AE
MATKCLSSECQSAYKHENAMLNAKERVCRFCGDTFLAKGSRQDCGKNECDAERRRLIAQKSRNIGRKSLPEEVVSKQGSPDRKYVRTYSIVAPKSMRGHAGIHFSASDHDASDDSSWLFKGRKPEAPRPPLAVKKNDVAVGWRAVHKRQYDYFLQKIGKAAIV